MEAIGLYEKALHTKADAAAIEYSEDGNRIIHAVLKIQDTEAILIVSAGTYTKPASVCWAPIYARGTF